MNNILFILTDIIGTIFLAINYLTRGLRKEKSEDIRDSNLFSEIEQGE